MAQRKSKSENSVNIKYSSVTGELVIDGVSMGMFVDAEGRHPTAEEMDTIVRLVQQRLPFDSKIIDNNKKTQKPEGGSAS